MTTLARVLPLLLVPSALAACSGTMPLLHPAQVLREGDTTVGAGVGGTFATGQAASAIRDARGVSLATDSQGVPGTPTSASDSATFARGALAVATGAAGLSPWVGGRVGLGHESEAGISWYGRALRVDLRHAFDLDGLALSVGAGASSVIPRRGSDSPELSGVDLGGTNGWGVDVPVLVGSSSRAGIASVWGGPRAGYEKLGGTIELATESPRRSGALDASRWYAGGVVGLSLGFRHLHGVLELDAYYQHAKGSLAGYDADVAGVTISPAAAIVGAF